MAQEIPVLTGQPGELVDRFIMALVAGAEADKDWCTDVLAFAFVATGGSGAFKDKAEPDENLVGLMARLNELLDAGMEEEFLIRSLRDEVRRRLDQMASLDATNEIRADTRRGMEEALVDRSARERLKARHPDLANLTDAEMIRTLQRLVTRLGPVSADEAARYWQSANRWHELVGQYPSDQDLRSWWRGHNFHRSIGRDGH